jgi:hypothetical protein
VSIQLNIDLDEFEKWLTPERVETAFYNAGFDVELKDEYKQVGGLQIGVEPLPERLLRFQPNCISTAYFSPYDNIEVEIQEFKKQLEKMEWSEYVQIIGFNEQRKCFSFKMETFILGQSNSAMLGLYFIGKGLRIEKVRSELFAQRVLKDMLKRSGYIKRKTNKPITTILTFLGGSKTNIAK